MSQTVNFSYDSTRRKERLYPSPVPGALSPLSRWTTSDATIAVTKPS